MTEERKWIRLQEAGLLMLLAIPVTIAVVGTVFGFTIEGPRAMLVGNTLFLVVLALALGGGFCFYFGAHERSELKRKSQGQEDNTE